MKVLNFEIMEENRKHLLDQFTAYLYESYQAYCRRHKVIKTESRLVTFIIDQDLIPSTNIQKYSILREFEKLNKEPNAFNKTQAVNIIAHRYNISERTVWNILKKKKSSKKYTPSE